MPREMTKTERAEFVWDVATGKKGEELEAIREELVSMKARIDTMSPGIQSLPPGAAQEQGKNLQIKAWQAYMQQVQEFNLAAVKHNEIANAISRYTLGLYSPGTVSMNLSAVPLIAMAWVGVIAGSMIGVIMALSTLMDSIKSRNTQVRGYIDQFSDLLDRGGNLIQKSGEAVSKVAWALIAVGAAFGVFALYREFRPVIQAAVRSKVSPAGGGA